ncbi:hypothetical protein H0H92_010319 [Tricholoma furcatifolium]|nr:hypothetical protein H0H92_010319 [Tricholoma furcatifolium]
MKFKVSAALLSLFSLAAATTVSQRRGCADAARFGVITFTPTEVNPGDYPDALWITKAGNFTDPDIPATSNNGYEAPIVLARRVYEAGSTLDEFTVEVPVYYYFAGAPYQVTLTNTHNTTSSPVLVQGSVYAGITINATSSD